MALYGAFYTIYIVLLGDIERDWVEEGSEVALLPVEAWRKGKFAALHLNNYYYITLEVLSSPLRFQNSEPKQDLLFFNQNFKLNA